MLQTFYNFCIQFKMIYTIVACVRRTLVNMNTRSKSTLPTSIKLKRVLLVTKLPRYEYERSCVPHLSQEEFEIHLKVRGSDIDSLLYFSELHKTFQEKVTNVLHKLGIEVKIVNKLTFSEEVLQWSDLVVPIGGDGTFLQAAHNAKFIQKPFMGLNSDPSRSEGNLCLNQYYSENVDEAFQKVLKGEISFLKRTRIRTTIVGAASEVELCTGRDITKHRINYQEMFKTTTSCGYDSQGFEYADQAVWKRLPSLALNEVFVGESVAVKPSHLSVQVDELAPIRHTKSSGICACTGTGATSWYKNIHRVTSDTVSQVVQLMNDPSLSRSIDLCKTAEEYNTRLYFPCDDPRLCYTVREGIHSKNTDTACDMEDADRNTPFKPHGFAKIIKIKGSSLSSGILVMDGNTCYPISNGMHVILEVNPDDALFTVNID